MNYSGNLRDQDFSGCDLAGCAFHNADLYRVSFRGTVLRGAEFCNCFAAEAVFDEAQGMGLRALDTNFFRASFRRARLHDALFCRCVLASADLRGASLRGVTLTLDCNSFEGARLSRAAGAALGFLLSRADSPQRDAWRGVLTARELRRMEKAFEEGAD